jgi:Fe-S-cluster containining protein
VTPELQSSLLALYSELEQAVALAGPKCELSGRCCRFAEFGHTLFLSALEADLLVTSAPPPVRPLDAGATCPWQDEFGRCQAREARPLGCRVYFCDPAYEETGAQLSEMFISRLKRLAEDLSVPWDYRPLHEHLRSALAAGAIAFPEHGNGLASPSNPSLPP